MIIIVMMMMMMTTTTIAIMILVFGWDQSHSGPSSTPRLGPLRFNGNQVMIIVII